MQVHVDRLGVYNDLMEMDTWSKAKAPVDMEGKTEEFEVEAILDDTGSRKEGSKQYLVKWAGYGPEDNSWVSMQDMVHCSDRVQAYKLKKVGVYSISEACSDGKPGLAVFGVEAGGSAVTLAMDMNGDESEEELLNRICKEAGVDRSDIVLTWASPPCESYSKTNWSNLLQGFNHRKLEKGFPPADNEKGTIAEQHDRLVQQVKTLLELVGCYVMENPKGGLETMEFMKDWENRKMVVDLSSFIWPFKKTTNLWVGNFEWKPAGTTGDGRCGDQCGQGAADILTKRFKHFMALAVDPQRGPRGAGATSMQCGIPNALIKEVLSAVEQCVSLKGKVVLDLCSGFQSICKAVVEAGATYVEVDVMGNCKAKPHAPRRAAVVLRCNSKVLAVKWETAVDPTRGQAERA